MKWMKLWMDVSKPLGRWSQCGDKKTVVDVLDLKIRHRSLPRVNTAVAKIDRGRGRCGGVHASFCDTMVITAVRPLPSMDSGVHGRCTRRQIGRAHV